MLTPKQFFDKWNNKGCDFDGFFSFQCMDVYQQFNKECVGGKLVHGNAVDMWGIYDKSAYQKIENTPTNVPQEGDVIIWGQGVGVYGHIAIFSHGDVNKFFSFEENWPVGSTCHFQPHSYKFVLGWLRPKNLIPKPVVVETSTPPQELPKLVELIVVPSPVDNTPVITTTTTTETVQVSTPVVETPQNSLQSPTDPSENLFTKFISSIVNWLVSILRNHESKK